MSCDEEYYLILHVGERSTFGDVKEFNREDDVKWVKAAKKGDVEGVEAAGEGDVEGVEAVRKGSTVGEDNDSGFGSSIGHENVIDFATSVGKDNVNAIANREKESETVLDENEIKIKTFQDEHYYSVSFKSKLVTTAMIVQHFVVTIKDHPKMKLREIQRICASNMHVNVSIDYFYKAKKIVKEKMVGNSKKEFGMLWDYAQELRPLIGLDGCFLKGPFKSEFLTTAGRDANNQMFFISWAMVKVECIDSWVWFLSLLSVDLGLKDGYGYTIISDQQKIMKSTIEREYEELCVALEKKDKEANNNLMRKSQKMWTRDIFWDYL
ncbi:hypothetical protein PVK06_020980 [Gossypium arboreum]|uniref:MULE transposase domain-containing protein n=1 Tax=Gossypium arboreum TaxID=29729 RepID=A0ABR0PNS1_GOSAR|nr:hypothetical protein PVK06_020980 [Gossypium arboreum]